MNPHRFFIGRAIGFLVVIAVGAFVYFFFYHPESRQEEAASTASSTPAYENISYRIEGKDVLLKNGYAEYEYSSGSASKMITRYFGNEATGDLNGDGMPDVAFLLTQDGGGTGTFYYAVVALKTTNGYTGTNAIYLGDRIAPQTTEIRDGELIVNYATRKEGEPMAARPSVGVSTYLHVYNGVLSENED